MNVIHRVIFTLFVSYFNVFYSMSPLMIEGMRDYQASKNKVLQHPTVKREEIGENIFLQKMTPDTVIITSEFLNFHLHCPSQAFLAERKKLLSDPYTKIFFSDTPELDEEGVVKEISDTSGRVHQIRNRDQHLFFYDYYNPTIYTQLIPKEVVAKDRICIMAFLWALKSVKKNSTLKLDPRMVREAIVPRLCVNIKEYLSCQFKTIGRGPEEQLEEDNSCLGRFFKNKHAIFKTKAQRLLDSFNIRIVEAIISHHFPKK